MGKKEKRGKKGRKRKKGELEEGKRKKKEGSSSKKEGYSYFASLFNIRIQFYPRPNLGSGSGAA